MRSSKFVLSLLLCAAAARANNLDPQNPRRAVGREDDVRIDAQLHQDVVSPGSPIGVVYQIQNLTATPVAIADRTAECTYDSDSGTVTLSIGSEVPANGTLPRMTLIAPGEKKTFQASALLRVNLPSIRSPFVAQPRFVQVKVSFLRDSSPIASLIDRQTKAPATAIALSDAQFDRWLESTDTIFLNALPVRYNPKARASTTDAERREAGSF
ncbi:MAG TPA: hypothetical protein VMU84_20800 [Thermoanaerobaculia bacterium]|nr:hypothetical protein [Thermoanaerobaculia bacterium]